MWLLGRRSWTVVGFLLFVGLLYVLVRHRLVDAEPVPDVAQQVRSDKDGLKEAPVKTVARYFTPWRATPKPEKIPEPEPVIVEKPVDQTLPVLIHAFEVGVREPVPVPKIETKKVRFGTVLHCRMLQSVNGGGTAVPVTAEVVTPLKRSGIPANARVFGSVKADAGSGRLESVGNWIIRLPGENLVEFRANAQERDFDVITRTFGMRDGSAGIVGKIEKIGTLKSTLFREGVDVAADAAQDRARTALGEIELGTARNAVLRGVSSLFKSAIPKPPENEIRVSVPAGKEFYLFVEDRNGAPADSGSDGVDTMLRERERLMEMLRARMGKEGQ